MTSDCQRRLDLRIPAVPSVVIRAPLCSVEIYADHCSCGGADGNKSRPHGRRPMKNSAQKIRTSHVGRLPVPLGFEETALRLARDEVGGEEVAADVVKRQVGIGLDCIGDGEYWSALDIKWFDQQMAGLGTRPLKPGEVGSMRESTRE